MSIYLYADLKIVPVMATELFNQNLLIVHPALFLKFFNSPLWGKSLKNIQTRVHNKQSSRQETFNFNGRESIHMYFEGFWPILKRCKMQNIFANTSPWLLLTLVYNNWCQKCNDDHEYSRMIFCKLGFQMQNSTILLML